MAKIFAIFEVIKQILQFTKGIGRLFQNWKIKKEHKNIQEAKDGIAEAIKNRDRKSLAKHLDDL